MSLRMVKREYGGILMRKSIKVSEELHRRLSQERKGGESFDEALKRLLRWDEK